MKTLVVLITLFIVNTFSEPINLENIPKASRYRENVLSNTLAFKKGEVLNYRIHYGIIDACEASIKITEENHKIAGREVIHVVGTGTSKGAFDWFFKVRDRYETYFDAKEVKPYIFVRRVDEGGYKLNQDYMFLHNKNQVDNGEGKKYDVPEDIQDMLSAFYYARNIEFNDLKPGDVFTVKSFVDNEVWPLQIKFIGKENVKLENGTYRCMKFVPVVQKGRIFKHEEDLLVWITDDKNKIPVMAKANILFGDLTMELTDFSNIAHPMALVK